MSEKRERKNLAIATEHTSIHRNIYITNTSPKPQKQPMRTQHVGLGVVLHVLHLARGAKPLLALARALPGFLRFFVFVYIASGGADTYTLSLIHTHTARLSPSPFLNLPSK